MAEKLLTRAQLKDERGIPYTDMHLRRLERAGKFPRRRAIVPGGLNGWYASEIDEWLASREPKPLRPQPAEPAVRISPRTGKPVRPYRRRQDADLQG